jgi:hypothetical protein
LRGWRATVVILGIGPALAACATSVNCTAVGCTSFVSVDISSLASEAAPLSVTATLCAQGTCTTQRVTFLTDANDSTLVQDLPSDSSSTSPASVPVTLRVVQGSKVLVDTATTATLLKLAPNGEVCGPVCDVARLVLAGDTLVPAVPDPVLP